MEAAATCSKCSETIAMAHGCCLVKDCRKVALPPLEAVADTVAVKLPARKATERRHVRPQNVEVHWLQLYRQRGRTKWTSSPDRLTAL